VQLFSHFIRVARVVKPLNALISMSPSSSTIPSPSQTARPAGLFSDIHSAETRVADEFQSLLLAALAKLRIFPRTVETQQPRCTNSCHPAVHGLHSAENRPHKLAIFSLTQNLKGVQQDRSLTVS
jgi:hypothetical protein